MAAVGDRAAHQHGEAEGTRHASRSARFCRRTETTLLAKDLPSQASG